MFVSWLSLGAGSIAYAMWQRWQPRPFCSYFVCHHKGGAAAQARFVQLLIVAKAGKKCFIDSDDLLNLDLLFDTVRSCVGHLVVYLTRYILTRPWCSGELVMSHKCSKKVTGVRTTEYRHPTKSQLADLA